MIRIPDTPESTLALADWVELSLLAIDEEPYRISDADIIGALTDAGLDAEIDRANISAEINRRSTLIAEAYPFFRDGQGFARHENWQDSLSYCFLLLASSNQCYADLVYIGNAARPSRLFEFASQAALAKYVGGQCIRIGASRVEPIPAALPDAVAYVAEALREQDTYGLMEEQIGGDDGCDLIAWRPFSDRRASQSVLLGQCAIGTDWRDKRSELDLGVWSSHINWHSKPSKSFCVPFVHEDGNSWRETATRGGIVFDRLRLVEHSEDGFTDEIAQQITDWCNERLTQVRQLTLEEAW